MKLKPSYIIALLVLLVLATIAMRKPVIDLFHSGTFCSSKKYWWSNLFCTDKTQGPYYDAERGAIYTDDLKLTNMYRKWHNIENVNRNEILEHQHVQNPGGDHTTNRQWFLAEAADRSVMKIQNQIENEIALSRPEYLTEADDRSPIDFPYNTYNIIGIPSVPGTIHSYY